MLKTLFINHLSTMSETLKTKINLAVSLKPKF